MTLTLPIARTWDGHPVDDVAAAQLDAAGPTHLVLRVLAPTAGDPPPAAPPGPTPRLWEHEVVELFVAGPGERYLEVELGPHGHHLVLRLDGVRRPVEQALPMTVTRALGDGAWAATAVLPRAWLPDGPHRVNAYRIHGPPDARRYLAHAAVPGAQPDFHQLHRFVPVELPTSSPAGSPPLVGAVAELVAAVAGVSATNAAQVVAALVAAGGGADPDRLAVDALARCRRSSPAAPRGSG